MGRIRLVAMPKQKYQHIRQKEDIPDDVRTEGKDAAAEIINTLIDRGDWPVPLNDIADNCDWSRSHLRNTIRDYFEPIGPEETKRLDITTDGYGSINIPSDVQNPDEYLRGVAAGINMARQSR